MYYNYKHSASAMQLCLDSISSTNFIMSQSSLLGGQGGSTNWGGGGTQIFDCLILVDYPIYKCSRSIKF